MNYEWWQLWIPFFGTLITSFITFISNRNQFNKSEKIKEELFLKQSMFKKSMVDEERENTRKSELREDVSLYIILLSNHRKELESFVKTQRELESMLEFNKQVISATGGYNALMSSDPRVELPKLNQQKLEHFERLKDLEVNINELSQKLVLYFTDSEENNEIVTLLRYAPEVISNVWGKIDSNINLEMMSFFIESSDTKTNRSDLEKYMRDYLNNG